MRSMGPVGIWELFLPGVGEEARYKYEILSADGEVLLKADPYAQQTEVPPKTASVITQPHHDVVTRRRGVSGQARAVTAARRADVDL